MIIHQPEIRKKEGMVILSTPIEFSNSIENIPKELWFSFPEKFEPYITPRIEAFLLGIMIPAMHYRENIELRGAFSPKLAYNLRDLMHLFHKTSKLSPINIRYQSLEVFQPSQDPIGVMTSFSGGVDSMYSLYAHLAENEPIPEARITHGLLIHGYNDFDIALNDHVYFERIQKQYLDLFGELGLELVVAKSNAYLFSKFRISWNLGYIPTQIAFVYLLSNLVKRFYHPTDGDYVEVNRADPDYSAFLSNETFDVINHTVQKTRFQKVEAISQWRPAHKNLRVCLKWDKQKVDINCSECHKCLSTMVLLEMTGAYEKFTTFKQPYPKNTLIRYLLLLNNSEYFFLTIKNGAKQRKRIDILFWIYLFNPLIFIKLRLINQIETRLSDQVRYRLRKFLYGPGVGGE
jgi:hypothetical protein